MTTAGQTIVFVNLLPTTKARDVRADLDARAQHDRRHQEPFSRRRAGAFLQRPLRRRFRQYLRLHRRRPDLRQLRDQVEFARSQILTMPNVGRVDLIGEQDEAIYLEFSTRQLAALGLDMQSVLDTLAAQNAITPSGFVQAGPERIAVRVSGAVHVRG